MTVELRKKILLLNFKYSLENRYDTNNNIIENLIDKLDICNENEEETYLNRINFFEEENLFLKNILDDIYIIYDIS